MLIEKPIPISYVFRLIQPDVVVTFFFAGALIFVEHSVAPKVLEPFQIPVAIPAFLGTAISLVLSFKLAQSYDRWWEARKIWGAIVNDSRSLVVQLLSFTGNKAETKAVVDHIAMRQMAWCYQLSNSLRKLGLSPELKRLLPNEEIAEIESHANQPLKMADMNSEDIRKLHADGVINDFQQIQLDSTLVRLVASMGKAERIKGTVFPKTYRLFLKCFIYVFIFSLAVALADLEPIFEWTVLIAISTPFFMLKRTAFQMQDPFENQPTDTAMLTISRTIETNLRQLIGNTDLPAIEAPDSFYVM